MKTILRLAKKSAKNIQKKNLEKGKLYGKDNRHSRILIDSLLAIKICGIQGSNITLSWIPDIFRSHSLSKNSGMTKTPSCFLENKYTKKDLSQPPMVHHAQGVQVF